MRDVIVRDVGPRDGLQQVKTVLPTATKLDWIRADVAAGVPEVEVCSFVPPLVIAQFADAVEVATEAARIAGYVPSALTPNPKGAEIGFRTGIGKINYVMSVSESHNQQNVRRTRAESLEGFRAIIAARDEQAPGVKIGIGLATSLGCTIEGTVPEAETLRLLEQVLDAGADEMMLPDTVGYAAPGQVRSLFRQGIAMAGEVPVWSHFHDTRGLGLANALAALEAGCTRFDASLAGLGGCPFAPGATGNIVLEDLVFLLESEGLRTGIDLEKLREARRIVEAALPDEPKYGQVLRAGLPKSFRPASRAA
ncbi:MAG TPA: hydroxymethylglutaryl-CoA lyase [Paracoccaceae bacterium]|nr:hydroxymethylglutaryl-CoA lyase [Paracoccaceae bacterium]